MTFAYDGSGIRTKKGAITYQIDGSRILSETRIDGTITYYYSMGGICGFKYNDVRYYYEKNLQGDITAIYDGNGNKKAEYQYDAWGNQTITVNVDGIGTLNPFRYRGYYYDTETGLYYLKNRYYDSQIGRFINADVYVSTGVGILGHHMFIYCNDNPVAYVDVNGNRLTSGFQYNLKKFKVWLDNSARKTAAFLDKVGKTIEDVACEIIDTTRKIQKACHDSVVIEAEVGTGVGVEAEVFGIGIEALAEAGVGIVVEDGQLNFDKDMGTLGITASAFGFSFGPRAVKEDDGKIVTKYHGKEIGVFSMSAYLGIGGRFSIGIDWKKLWDDIYEALYH